MFGIPALLYQTIYLIVVTILTIVTLITYTGKSYIVKSHIVKSHTGKVHIRQSTIPSGKNNISFVFSILFLVFIVFYIGLRPLSWVFADMMEYNDAYYRLSSPQFKFSWEEENVLFKNMMMFLSSKGFSSKTFFVIIAAIYFCGIFYAFFKLFPKDVLASFLVYLAAFSTFSYGTNGIKAGAAASLFLIAIAMNNREKKLWTIVFLFLSWGFHHSMVLPIVSFVVCKFVKKPKWFFYFWFFCFLLALFHVTVFQDLFGSWVDEKDASYLINISGKTIKYSLMGGFRIDFILYGAVPVIIGWVAVYRKKIVSQKYYFLLNLYTFINAIWMLCMYAEFTNRIAYLSWFMYPVVLIYPFLREQWGHGQYRTFRWVAYGQLAFTLFMSFIYN